MSLAAIHIAKKELALTALRAEWRVATPKRIKTPTERKIWSLWLVESSPCVSRGRGDCCGNITAVYNNTSIILPG